MAGKKISQLNEISNPALNSLTVVVSGNTSFKSTLSTLRSTLVDSGSHTFTGSQKINGNLIVSGSITAQEYILSSSVSNITIESISGSTAFGNSLDDNHLFTGSLKLTGSLQINGTTYSPTASYSLEAITASFANQALSASSVVTASFANEAVTSSYAISASYATSIQVFPYTGSATITGSLELTGSLSNGLNSVVSGLNAHAEGITSLASGNYSHAEGYYTTASGYASHTEGRQTSAAGNYSHAEGWNTKANSAYAHAEGRDTIASGQNSHAEGELTVATAQASHAEGYQTNATANGAHAEGFGTTAEAFYAHSEGNNTKASGNYQLVVGQYNISSSVESAFIIGNGSDDANRKNLVFTSGSQFEITGSLYVTGSITVYDMLVIVPQSTLPLTAASGSIMTSGSGVDFKPYFFNGNTWVSLL